MKRIIALCGAALAAVCWPAGAATLGEALNATSFTWATGGNAAWVAQSATTHDGLWAAQSGPITDSQETWMETTVAGPGPLSFWWKVSSESGWDYLEIYTNAVRAARISGEVGWQVKNYTLGTGTQVLRWRYTKDGSGTSGQDRGWVDQVSFPFNGPPVTVDNGFNPGASGSYAGVASLAVQADGKILVGGRFTTLDGQTRNNIGRLNEDGTLDSSFNPGAGGTYPGVYSLAVQADGKILVGGGFTTLGGQTRNRIARLNADGTVDSGFNPGANDAGVSSLAVQADGKILVGGLFNMLGGQDRSALGRLNVDGTLDSGFNPRAFQIDDNGFAWPASVSSLTVQADGKILVGGSFNSLGGQTRNYIGRLNVDGALDSGFNPGAGRTDGQSPSVGSLAVQPDGKILVGGGFTRLGGQTRNYIGRLNVDGTLDSGFNPGAGRTDGQSPGVGSLAVQADGKILVGGFFTTLGGQTRNCIGRLNNTAPATQSLSFDGSTITWLRGGTSPEVWRTTFDLSTDGLTWTNLAAGTRIAGGWQLAVASSPLSGVIRARGYVAGSDAGSGWFVESQLQFTNQVPTIVENPQSVTKLNWATATFSAAVTGTPPLSFQWRCNGTNLVDGKRISGTRTSTLTMTNVQSQDDGFYMVVVSNPWGSVTSAPALLRVLSVEYLTLSVSNQSPARFDFTNAAWVDIVLTDGFAGAPIFYTLDGSPPSPASGLYFGTLVVSNTVVVRAIAYNPVDFSPLEMAPAAVNLWTAFRLLATTTAGGRVALEPPGGFYLSNTVVALAAVPEAGWEFLSWTGDASGASSNLNLVMDRDKIVTAQFGLIPRFTLAVTTAGSGAVSGNTQSNYLRGTTANLSAQPAPGWEFLSWTGDASGTSSNISLVMDRDKSVTARFGQTLFTLAVTTVGAGAVSGNTQSNYSRGTAVNLTAEPVPGWYFQSWTGDADGTSRNVSVVMDGDKNVVARFAPLTLLAVTAGGGAIAANPASNYVQDSTAELTAQPQSGWTFLNWMGDASGTNPQASVTMDRPKEVQAVFGTECNTTVLGQGAVVRQFGTGLVPFGTVVRMTAIPQPGYYFALWGNALSSVVNPLDFTVTNANPTVGALFSALGANQATLTVREQGAGVVAREPQANAYTKGQAVRLTAQPFPGQNFLGWAGDASGTQNPLSITPTTNQTITATFTHRLSLAIQPWPGPTQRRGFLFLLAGDEGTTCLVQTSPDLADWQPLTTLTISNAAVQFIDVAVTNQPRRFYKAATLP